MPFAQRMRELYAGRTRCGLFFIARLSTSSLDREIGFKLKVGHSSLELEQFLHLSSLKADWNSLESVRRTPSDNEKREMASAMCPGKDGFPSSSTQAFPAIGSGATSSPSIPRYMPARSAATAR